MNWKDDSKFPARLRQVREKAGLSQSEFAERVGLSRGAISTYELGDRVPDIRFMEKVIEEFDCSYDYLMGKSENTIPAAKVLSDVLAPLNDDVLRLILDMPTELNLVATADSTSLYCLILYLAIYASRAAFEADNQDIAPSEAEWLDLLEKLNNRVENTFSNLLNHCRTQGYEMLADNQRTSIREIIDRPDIDTDKAPPLAAKSTRDALRLLAPIQYENAKRQLRQLDEEYRRKHHAP